MVMYLLHTFLTLNLYKRIIDQSIILKLEILIEKNFFSFLIKKNLPTIRLKMFHISMKLCLESFY